MTFKKVLVANRGEIAVRIIRTCHEIGIPVVSLYQIPDRCSLHVRLADECVQLNSPMGYFDQEEIIQIALEKGADAIHPGYGFLTEREDFIQKCGEAGLKFIGPPAHVIQALRQKTEVLQRAKEAGFPVPDYSPSFNSISEIDALQAAANDLTYPVVIKSCRGGRGRGERLVWSPERLRRAVRWAQAESMVIYGSRQIYLEKAIRPAHQIGVQIVADLHGNLIHLGEREGSLLFGNQKVIEESPAPSLNRHQRQALFQAALELARLFRFENVGTVEFQVDGSGAFFFTEIKPRIQIEHPLTEVLSGVDLVRQQICIAAGEPLKFQQEDFLNKGWAIQCRLRAEDPWKQFLPSPGEVQHLRLPDGPNVRVDTYLQSGCEIPSNYDPLIAKLITWGESREISLQRMRQALKEFQLVGTMTNLALLQRIIEQSDFGEGHYSTEFIPGQTDFEPEYQTYYRDLALIAAVAYLRKNRLVNPTMPGRFLSGWHRDSRRLVG